MDLQAMLSRVVVEDEKMTRVIPEIEVTRVLTAMASRIEPAFDNAQKGDFVRFVLDDKEYQICLGKGCLREYEALLDGACVNEVRRTADGREAKVCSVMRREQVEISDALVQRLELPGINTWEAFRQHYRESKKQDYTEAVFNRLYDVIADQLAGDPGLEVDADALDEYVTSSANGMRQSFESVGEYEAFMKEAFGQEPPHNLEACEARYHNQLKRDYILLTIAKGLNEGNAQDEMDSDALFQQLGAVLESYYLPKIKILLKDEV